VDPNPSKKWKVWGRIGAREKRVESENGGLFESLKMPRHEKWGSLETLARHGHKYIQGEGMGKDWGEKGTQPGNWGNRGEGVGRKKKQKVFWKIKRLGRVSYTIWGGRFKQRESPIRKKNGGDVPGGEKSKRKRTLRGNERKR